MDELDALNESGDSRDLQYAQAISDLSQRKVVLEVAQQSFIQITGLSLFNYIR